MYNLEFHAFVLFLFPVCELQSACLFALLCFQSDFINRILELACKALLPKTTVSACYIQPRLHLNCIKKKCMAHHTPSLECVNMSAQFRIENIRPSALQGNTAASCFFFTNKESVFCKCPVYIFLLFSMCLNMHADL